MREESLSAVAEAIQARTLSPVEAVEGCLGRVHKWDGRIRAFIRLDEEVRLPAACCGVVGLKPTYGRVSRAGALVLSWSMDHLGPLAWTARAFVGPRGSSKIWERT